MKALEPCKKKMVFGDQISEVKLEEKMSDSVVSVSLD